MKISKQQINKLLVVLYDTRNVDGSNFSISLKERRELYHEITNQQDSDIVEIPDPPRSGGRHMA